MSLVDDLIRLEQLRRSGALSESEFDAAKRMLLQTPDQTERDSNMAAMMRLDRDWQDQQREYLVQTRHGQRAPSFFLGAATLLIGLGGGIASIAAAFSTSVLELGLLGGVLLVSGVFQGISELDKAQRYSDALRRYEATKARAGRSRH